MPVPVFFLAVQCTCHKQLICNVADSSNGEFSGFLDTVQESEIYARTNHYATCHLRLYTAEPDYGGAWLDQVEIKLTGDVECSAMNFAFNCVLTIIESVSGDTQGSVPYCMPHRPQPGVMVWGANSFDSRTSLVFIRGTLTAQRCVDDILRTVLLPSLLQYLGFIFQKIRPDYMRQVLL
ncbi:hypothetical protein TNCV_883391 [Trichonephila clavipes]|nr:hypothetical protein TNCV_883391 [Trichonephila clavipes]